jgi:hypothetical protein
MKRSITATGLLSLVAMILVGVFSTGSALAGGGPNSVFLWTGPLPGLVLVLSDNTQVFTAIPGGTSIECEHFRGHGIASNGKAMSTKEITLTGQYNQCFAGGAPAVVTPAELLLNADGSLTILGRPIVITIPLANCSIKVHNGGANTNLRLLLFLNLKEDLLVHVEISKLASLSTGGACGGAAGEELKEGTYRGLLLAFVDGGTLRWDR